MEKDLDFSTDLVSDDSLNEISVDESVELLDFEDTDVPNCEFLEDTETEILDMDDFNDETLYSDFQNDEDETEVLDFENSDMDSDVGADEFNDDNSELSHDDFNEALIDNSVRDVPFVDVNYEDSDDVNFSDLENPDAINEDLADDCVLTDNDFDDIPNEPEDASFDSNELSESELNDSTVSESYDGLTDGTYHLEEHPSMSEEELGNFVNWENQYGDEIQDIQNDPTLTNEEKSVLLSSAYNDFISGGDTLYSDADLDVDPGIAKILTPNSGVNRHISSYNNIGLNDATDNVTDVNDWLGDINPNYDEWDTDSPYSNNCGSCAYAVWNRLNGIDDEMCATAENIGYNSDMEALTGMEQVSMSPEEIESTLLAQGDGANAIIGIDRAEGFGHWFNAACIDGKVVAIDGQTGEINDWPPDYGDVINWEMSIKKGA